MIPVGGNFIYKQAARYAAVIVAILTGCHYWGAAPAALVVLAGCGAAMVNKVSIALSAFILLPFIMVFNPVLIPKMGMFWGLSLRGGPLLIGLCLSIVSQKRKGKFKLPINMLWMFLFIAAICSIQGYFPKISYAKLANFALFLWVVCESTKNLQFDNKELFKLRAFLLGLMAILIFGSLFVYQNPAISTLNGVSIMRYNDSADSEIVGDYISSMGGAQLFVGLLNHPQTFAGVMSCGFGWLICDMLFVEKRIKWPHMIMIVISPALIFITRSRMGLLIMTAFCCMLYFYTMKHINLPHIVKNRINGVMTMILVLGVLVLAVGEARTDLVSRWLRKRESIGSDERDLTEAVTSSRQGLIAENINDFRRNKLLGSGFQVAAKHVDLYKGRSGIIITAPIEKGILPLMVLGETGILGAIFFFLFLLDFVLKCTTMKLWSTLTLFTTFFVSNMAEATFFSPGGAGGIEWCFTIVGGFICDSYIRSMEFNPASSFAISKRMFNG